MKNNTIYASDIMLTLDDIYIGKIRCRDSFEVVKDALLVKLNCTLSTLSVNIYVELENFDLNLFKQKQINAISLLLGDIMADKPLYAGTYYVDASSVRKYNYKQGVATGISSKQNQKVKKLVKEINQKGE